jgi:hypothetical protein
MAMDDDPAASVCVDTHDLQRYQHVCLVDWQESVIPAAVRRPCISPKGRARSEPPLELREKGGS